MDIMQKCDLKVNEQAQQAIKRYTSALTAYSRIYRIVRAHVGNGLIQLSDMLDFEGT